MLVAPTTWVLETEENCLSRDFSFRHAFSRYMKFHLLRSVPEIIALVGSCSGQEVLNDSHTNVVTHALQLPIHIVDVLIILGNVPTIVPLTIDLDDDYTP